MIKHKFNDEKQQKLPKKYLEIDISILYFILNSPSLTRDVTCSKLQRDGRNTREECQMNNLHTV